MELKMIGVDLAKNIFQAKNRFKPTLILKAKRFFPVHWGMFVLSLHSWYDPVDQLLKLSKERGVNIMTLKLGQLVSISDDYRNIEWWLDLK